MELRTHIGTINGARKTTFTRIKLNISLFLSFSVHKTKPKIDRNLDMKTEILNC
jgi:hypothetical protein